jgi:transcription-repair coupling factor (superfamily II helicase)
LLNLEGRDDFAERAGVAGLGGLEGIESSEGIESLDRSDGLDGLSGFDGFLGLDGLPKRAGYSGLDGLPGREGFSGLSVSLGLEGRPGLDGLPGREGFSGLEPFAGLPAGDDFGDPDDFAVPDGLPGLGPRGAGPRLEGFWGRFGRFIESALRYHDTTGAPSRFWRQRCYARTTVNANTDETAIEPLADRADEATTPPRQSVALELLAELVGSRSLGREDVTGARGGSLAWLVAESVQKSGRKLVVLTNDLESARKIAGDVEFFLLGGGPEPEHSEADERHGEVLVLPVADHSPFVEVAPDRTASMGRLATLFHLSQGLAWRVLVVPAGALVRKVVPRAALAPRSDLVQVEELVDRDKLIEGMVEGGYLRVPIVEDPGTFAVRGSVLDVWPASSAHPARIELDEELCVSIKLFDPEGQRTLRAIRELFLHPVREALIGPDERSRARERVTALCDELDLAHAKVVRLTEDVESGRGFFGSDGFLPAYYEALESIFDYLPRDVAWVIDEPARTLTAMREELERALRDRRDRVERRAPCFSRDALYLDESDAIARLLAAPKLVSHDLAVRGHLDPDDPAARALELVAHERPLYDLGAESLERLAQEIRAVRAEKGRHDALAPLVEHVRYWSQEGYRVIVTGRTATQAERVAALLRAHDADARLVLNGLEFKTTQSSGEGVKRPDVEVLVGELSTGFTLPSRKVVFVTEEEIFGARARRTRRQRSEKASKTKAFIDDLRALTVGDYVVHADHGIGRYLGLEHRKIGANETDLLVLEYAGGDRFFLPVTRLNQIQKWSGGEGAPRLDRLGGTTFAKSKARVEREVRQMADELLRLYAERRAHPGRAFKKSDLLYREFEATFAFEETDDQRRAIDEVLGDLSSTTPMDRLVCGDVGFGKTEVAIRAAFHVASQGAQVAVLCPTTVLAQQHFHTFADRMRSYALEVAVLSRFVTPAKQRETLDRLKKGQVDVLVGTHRILSKDVHFKDLGLLVVDEEQRFGVKHKEQIKQLRARLDVLTLSATPIPRTLQMAVSGLRELSLITTPPVDRRAVRTVVSREDPALVREAVMRELSRGGQCFYVFNRVEGLYERAEKLQQLVPSARVAVAHGQMSAEALETVMTDFVEGRYDVLCSTAIIESGIDIPRANTMIVDRADLFGLSQLYQIRGRVGRSRERAYCYLLVPPPTKLSDEARQRIEAIEKFTELGAGFHVATLDMELRGAGDLLSGEQSGNIAQVGFELYVQMLEEAVAELKGEPVAPHVEPDLSFDEPFYLPAEYIEDVGLRLSLYKRLACAETEEDVAELAQEMEDRFGVAPAPARVLVRVMELKARLRPLRAMGIEANRERVVFHLREDSPVDGSKVAELCQRRGALWKLTPDLRLSRRFGEGTGMSNAERALKELEDVAVL